VQEPDYAIFLIRAERAFVAIYPAMANGKYKEAAIAAYEVVAELMSFLKWITTEKGKG
jgi:hypothetical protein